jgi:hypothetical protein
MSEFRYNNKHIIIGCPIRGRSEYLPYYLYCLYMQSYSTQRIGIRILLNYNEEDEEELAQLKENERIINLAIYKLDLDISVIYMPYKNLIKDSRSSSRLEIYGHLANIRNILKEKKSSCRFFMFLDSDIFLEDPDTISKLVENIGSLNTKKAVSLLIENGHGATNAMIYDLEKRKYIHLPYHPNTGLRKCDLTGAGFLIPYNICIAHDFGFSTIGEDEPFCRSMRNSGVKIFQDTNILAYHCMNLEELEKYKISHEFRTRRVQNFFYQ